MYIYKQLTKWLLGLALLATLLSACTAKTSPTATPEQTQFSDPFAYCTAVGDVDAPDARYTGPAVPDQIVKDLRKKAEIADDAPAEWVNAGTVWRCMDGRVWACFVGANLPCSEKADVSATPQPELNDFCKANPQADVIPEAVTGRATVYEWRCADGAPQTVKQFLTPDARGFLSNFWYEMAQ